jgi:hypothetical protein
MGWVATTREWRRWSVGLVAIAAVAAEVSLGAVAPIGPADATAPDLNPVSVSFVSVTRGWAIVDGRCRETFFCTSFVATIDAGQHWVT